MGSQPLNAKNTARIGRTIGVELVRAVAHGGNHVLSIVSADHRHGAYNPKTGEVRWYDGSVLHFTSCRTFFPDYE